MLMMLLLMMMMMMMGTIVNAADDDMTMMMVVEMKRVLRFGDNGEVWNISSRRKLQCVFKH